MCPTPPEDPCSSGRRGPEGISEVVQWSENQAGWCMSLEGVQILGEPQQRRPRGEA